jgi:hypothetical protein
MPTLLRNLLTPRFSLRALLVLVTVGCLTLGWRASRVAEFYRASSALKSNGITIRPFTYDGEEFDLKAPLLWDNGRAEYFYVHGPQGASYQSFNELWPCLAQLCLKGTIHFIAMDLPSDPQTRTAAPLTGIKRCEFSHCRFRGNAFSHAVQQMPELKSLRLSDCEIGAAALSTLAQSKQLEELTIRECPVAPNTISEIGGVNIKSLELIEILGENQITLSEADFKAISRMTRLEKLVVVSFAGGGSPISALQHLKKCTRLNLLKLDLEHISKSHLESAKREMAALPNCRVDLYSIPESK